MINIWSNLKNPILALAPMAGYTDSAFRIMCLKNGADFVYTEMISAEGLARENNPLRPRSEARKTLKMLEFLPEEKNIIIQLFGTNPEAFGKATKIIDKISENYEIPRPPTAVMSPRDDILVRGIDINFGCPAKKVFKTGAGAALMDNKKLAREIIEAVLKNTKLPLSIKIRAQVKNTSAEDFIKYIKDLPISMVMVHGRTLVQGFSGEINYEAIRNVKNLLPNTIVLGNGGINSVKDALMMIEKTGCDGVGIARGALGQPWIFLQVCHPDDSDSSRRRKPARHASQGDAGGDLVVDWRFIKTQILAHAKLFLKQNENLIPLRKHLVHYVKGLSNASDLRQKLIRVETLEELKEILS
jgi:tRNA-dihydrouridine synthase B